MPFIEKIVDYINTSLKDSSLNDKRFQPGKYVGCTTLLVRKNGDQLETVPATSDENGEYKTVEPNDKFNIIIYHRTISNVYAKVINNAQARSFGDDYALKCTSEMQLAVIADSRKVKMLAEQLEPMIIYGIPQRLPSEMLIDLGLRSCIITPTASVMDKINVFRQEYPNTQYFLKPFHQLFLVRYRVETGFDKNCVEKCLCGAAS
jgi:hypothetical protein